ncbi:MAG: rhodanese-like domain-containing protein [Gammaproteobacteria bacterium]|nr:rhodanese-like domain-containing protein [Gammaproteobacteria bacterium]
MKHTNSTLFSLLLVALVGACSTGYDFRGENRPSFENTVSATELSAKQADGATVLDVRLIEDFNADPVLVPDAMYRDPDDIQKWAAQMSPEDGPVIVYCVRGKWVSQKAANYLKEEGFEVYSLDGGMEGWKSAGQRTVDAQ